HVISLGHNLPGQLLLDSQTPSLLVGDIVADAGYGADCVKSYVIQRSQLIALRQFRTRAREWITQSGPRQNWLIVEARNPLRLLIVALITPRARPGSTRARLGKVDAISAAKHRAARQLIGESESGLNSTVVRIVVVAMARTCEDLTPLYRQVWQARRRQRVSEIGIQPVHPVEAFGARQRNFIA